MIVLTSACHVILFECDICTGVISFYGVLLHCAGLFFLALCRSPWLTMPVTSDQTRQSVSVTGIGVSILDLEMPNSAAVATTHALAKKRFNRESHWTIDIATAVLGEPCAYDHGATRMQTAHTLFPKDTCHTGNVVRACRKSTKSAIGSAPQTAETTIMQVATER